MIVTAKNVLFSIDGINYSRLIEDTSAIYDTETYEIKGIDHQSVYSFDYSIRLILEDDSTIDIGKNYIYNKINI